MQKTLIIALLAAAAISAGAVERKVKRDEVWKDHEIVEFSDSDQLAIVFTVEYNHEYRTYGRCDKVLLALAGFPELLIANTGFYGLLDSISADKRPTAVEFQIDDRGNRLLWKIHFEEVDFGPRADDYRIFNMQGYGNMILQLCTDSAILAKVPEGQLVVKVDSTWSDLRLFDVREAIGFHRDFFYDVVEDPEYIARWRNQTVFISEEQYKKRRFDYVTLNRAPNGLYYLGYALE